MKSRRWIAACAAVVLGLASVTAFAKEHGRGHGKGKEKAQSEKGKQKGQSEMEFRYSDHDREAIRAWYNGRGSNLPPGLAKRDQLPPGLEQQLVVRGTLPPGLRKKMRRCPGDLVRVLPPPPPDCRHVLIGGHIVLLNRRTNVVVDIFHLEL
jgi:hypothetical protein